MDPFLPNWNDRDLWMKSAAKERRERTEFWSSVPNLPERPKDAHKGTFGTALAIGGSRGMSGAVALAGSAALFAGAGLTRLAVPDRILETVAQFQREYTTIPVACDSDGRFAAAALSDLLAHAEKATAVAVGPGLGLSADLLKIVPELFFEMERPAVFDADALNALALAGVFDPHRPLTRVPRGPRILTPHPGEFARLSGRKPRSESERLDDARSFLDALQKRIDDAAMLNDDKVFPVTLALKGAKTVVAESRSNRIFVNDTGNPNMATGGSGDVLTGTILGLLAQTQNAFESTVLAVALCGLAADLRAKLCSRGGIASDAVRFMPLAMDYLNTIKERRDCSL